MLTAKATEADVVDGMESGADEYLIKPFGSNELKARVASLIHRRRQLQQHLRTQFVMKGKDVVVSSDDALLLESVSAVVDARLDDPTFGVDWLADEVGLSRRQLERKLDAILGETPAMLIRRFRLERASQLLRARSGTVAEIAYAVGFTSPAYFAKVFRTVYDELPSEHARGDV
jgi:transcriptional regulator GlxA family with amidase domain